MRKDLRFIATFLGGIAAIVALLLVVNLITGPNTYRVHGAATVDGQTLTISRDDLYQRGCKLWTAFLIENGTLEASSCLTAVTGEDRQWARKAGGKTALLRPAGA
ncbi:hypothetical protein [Azospirillum sp. sgz302134]